jgi:hypothetical protein
MQFEIEKKDNGFIVLHSDDNLNNIDKLFSDRTKI